MITIKDIQTAVAKKLKDNGYTVIASEVKEGFQKPACFVDVMPVSVELQNVYSELVTDSIEISFFPSVETREELVTTAEHFKQIFLYSTIAVNDRFLSVNEITFDYEKPALVATFDLEYLQETGIDIETMPKMKHLSERVVTESNGTSADYN
ncbi:MAG: hypothetical protein K5768_09085 [Firmicutes bacterium]|nr:hypothetical protein [Bacillota bacterium]